MKALINKIKCLCGVHETEHAAWSKELGPFTRYYSAHICKHCKKVVSEKSDIL